MKKQYIKIIGIILTVVVCMAGMLGCSSTKRFDDDKFVEYTSISKDQECNNVKFLGGAYFKEFECSNKKYNNENGYLAVLKVVPGDEYSDEEMFFEIQVGDKIYKSDQIAKFSESSSSVFLISRIDSADVEQPKILLTVGKNVMSVSSRLVIADEFFGELKDSFESNIDLANCLVRMAKNVSYYYNNTSPVSQSELKTLEHRIMITGITPELYDTKELDDYQKAAASYILEMQSWANNPSVYTYEIYSDRCILKNTETMSKATILGSDVFYYEYVNDWIARMNDAVK